MHTAVWKIGGSLFDLPDLVPRLKRLLSNANETRVLLVPGGGWLSRSVREWQQRMNLDDVTAHELAVHAMDFNAQLFAAALPGSEVVATPIEAAGCWQRGRVPVLSPSTWLFQQEREQPSLPQNWAVTSDSIAAWIAARWHFDELALLKSRSLEGHVDAATAAGHGWVDPFFPQVVRNLPRVAWCNLRAESPQVESWLDSTLLRDQRIPPSSPRA
jgi:aspartokinase-like uncharacterized kinase